MNFCPFSLGIHGRKLSKNDVLVNCYVVSSNIDNNTEQVDDMKCALCGRTIFIKSQKADIKFCGYRMNHSYILTIVISGFWHLYG